MKLPYKWPHIDLPKFPEFWSGGDGSALIDEYVALLKADAGKNSELFLEALVFDASSTSDCVGICLVTGGAHGYEFQNLVIQHSDRTFTVQKWNDISKETETYSSTINLDLPTELIHLRQDNIVLGSTRRVHYNVDRKSGMEGRGATIYVVVGSETEWLSCPNLLLGGEYENNAANRILRAVYGLDGKVTLI
jgi:hypothetical protein